MSDRVSITNADVTKWAAEYDGPPFHAMLCDPPYHLNSIVKRFAKTSEDDKVRTTAGPHQRTARGFMNQDWDGGDIAFRPETWAALGAHLHPGAFIIAFAGTRGYHRMTCAIEDAGFEIHPLIIWAFGCLSEDTEILTRNGWEPYDKATEGTDILSYNNSAGTFQFEPVEELLVYPYDETAYNIRSARTDQIVSRNHRCLVERADGFEFVKAEALEREETVPILESLPDLLESIRSNGQRQVSQTKDMRRRMREEDDRAEEYRTEARRFRTKDDPNNLPCLHDSEVETERLGAQARNGILLAQLQRQSDQRTRAATLCSEWQGKVATRNRTKRREESRMEGRSHILPKARELRKRKVCEMPGGILADGAEGRLRYGTSVASCASNLQAINANGSCSPRRPRSYEQRAAESATIRDEQGSQTVRASRQTTTTLATVTPIHYRGNVWCVRVHSGAFVARRNGQIFVTGNSGFPKATRIKGHTVFEGHRYGLQAMKPALECICVAQKPYAGKRIESITKTGAGALNIDGGRIGLSKEVPASPSAATGNNNIYNRGFAALHERTGMHPNIGRWPANLALEEQTAAALDRQSGNCHGAGSARKAEEGSHSGKHGEGWGNMGASAMRFGDEGGASRFYHVSDWRAELEEPFGYFAKAGRAERDAGLDRMPAEFVAMHLLAGDGRNSESPKSCVGGQQARIERGLTPTEPRRNVHPTIKPLRLTKWLATLLLPPAEYTPRRLLVPFAGSGSEAIGAALAGWEEVTGIELSAEYADIARARAAFWQGNSGLFESLTATEEEPDHQAAMEF